MPECPVCFVSLSEHEDVPCLHAWVAALKGEWVCWDGREIEYTYWASGGGGCWRIVSYCTDYEHVWPMLVELWRTKDFELWSDQYQDRPEDFNVSILKPQEDGFDGDTPELAVVKAWIATKSEEQANAEAE